MSDEESKDVTGEENPEEEKLFWIERAKTGRAKCKKCKNAIDTGSLRLAKMVTNPFASGKMKVWHHVPCLFEAFKKQRATTAKIENIDDIGGYETLSEEDIAEILKYLPESAADRWKIIRQDMQSTSNENVESPVKKKKITAPLVISSSTDQMHKDNSLRHFRKICVALVDESSYLSKTNVLKNFFEKGSDGNSFKGDLLLWCRLLLPGAIKTVYNLQSKQLIKIFSRIFQTDQEEMLRHLDEGDVAITVSEFFQKSKIVRCSPKSKLSLQEVNEFLQQLSKLTKEEDQQRLLTKISEKSTANDLQMIIRLIKHDLRINAGPKHILDALHPDAYRLYKTCQDIDSVMKQITDKSGSFGQESLDIKVKLLTPVSPMLAEACTSLPSAITKHPEGLYAETKYDGERVQLHKKGSDFKYFSRSLKPVLPHKVNHFKDYIIQSFPGGNDLILDCEVLMVDTKTGNPLPFGTLGIHKKNEFKDATPCLFIFDCLYFNGDSLLNSPLKERREILQKNMKEIPNHLVLSEIKIIRKLKDLESMLTNVLDSGLEGLVLKDITGVYEPGKRRWIKVKRDYLFEGKAADTVDLIVLGAWYGTGNKGGMMSVFLMGVYDFDNNIFKSVTKVHGHDDETLKALQSLDMIKISKDFAKVPPWLSVTKTMAPDFIATDPKKMPVWEIAGHEFTKHDVHTADGISIRFPRVLRVREDKTWETATNLVELKDIYEKSKINVGSRLLQFLNAYSESDPKSETSPTKKPRKQKENLEKREEDKTEKKKGRKTLPDQPLPDLLAGKRFKMSDGISEEFRRYFVAYGAEIVGKFEKATHRVVPGSFSVEKNSIGEKMLKIQIEEVK